MRDFYLQPKAGEVVKLSSLDQALSDAKIIPDTEKNPIAMEGIDESPTDIAYSVKENSRSNFKAFKGLREKTTDAAIADQIGSAIVFVCTEIFPDLERRESIVLNSIAYSDGVKEDFRVTILKYKWLISGEKYEAFVSHLRTEKFTPELHYFPGKNEIMTVSGSYELDDCDNDGDDNKRSVRQKLPEMVVPGLVNNRGHSQC